MSTCPKCKSDKASDSPTGFWCNNCGYQSPCQCWRGDHEGCRDAINKKRKESGFLPLVEKCCCAE